MNCSKILKRVAWLIALCLHLAPGAAFAEKHGSLPNILWITAEDHGPHLGCYGDAYATTPNLDAFAARSLRYTRASSNAPVCSAARTTLISGMLASSTGGHHMRSRVAAPDGLRFYPSYLRDLGYYATNNSKEDYNLTGTEPCWDESSAKAHWRNRPKGAPFFAIFNTNDSHESKIRNENANPHHDPKLAPVPPYLPDLPETRQDIAQYYDRLTEVDTFFQKRMEELEKAGLADDTIVFFFADHGSGMPRSKRYPGWSGLHVPLIVYVPDKYKSLAPSDYLPGGASDRLVSFIDLAPTLLSIAGQKRPPLYEGSAFMGTLPAPAPEYSFGFRGRMDERPDFSRSATDGRYIYIRNFMPHLPHGQWQNYQLKTPTTAAWRSEYKKGTLDRVQAAFWEPRPPEQLFDLRTDPYETINLIGDPAHAAAAKSLAAALRSNMAATRDTGILTEPYMRRFSAGGMSSWALTRSAEGSPVEGALAVLDLQLQPDLAAADLRGPLEGASDIEAYWAAMTVLWKGGALYSELEEPLRQAARSRPDFVQVAAAEAIVTHARSAALRKEGADRLYQRANYGSNDLMIAIHALNALDHVAEKTGPLPYDFAALPSEDPSIPGWARDYLPSLLSKIRFGKIKD